jgi:hypothetical protein
VAIQHQFFLLAATVFQDQGLVFNFRNSVIGIRKSLGRAPEADHVSRLIVVPLGDRLFI